MKLHPNCRVRPRVAAMALLTLSACAGRSAPISAVEAQERSDVVYQEAARAGVDAEFRGAVAAYEAAVERAEDLVGGEQEMAIRQAIERLARAIELLPHADPRNVRVASTQMRALVPGATIGFVSETAELEATRRALWLAAWALDGATLGAYRNAPDARTFVDELQHAVGALYDPEQLRRSDAPTLDALVKAKWALRVMMEDAAMAASH